jgi:hypothetical protein
MRIKGVGSEYSDLLEAAGVDSPAELAHRNAANLAATVEEVAAARPGIVRGCIRDRRLDRQAKEMRGHDHRRRDGHGDHRADGVGGSATSSPRVAAEHPSR